MFKPTNLYIKKHQITGLMYFGKTIRNDPHKYIGSGIVWRRHIKKHGKNVDTLWTEKFTDRESIKEFAEFFSEFFDIVKSKNWANLMPENGLDGGVSNISEETRNKMSVAAKKRDNSTRFDLNSIDRHQVTEETKQKISAAQKGVHKTDQHKKNMWLSRGGKHSEETKQKMRTAQILRRLKEK